MLLDTHVLLWLLDDNPRLGPETVRQIRSAHRVYASSVSVTEISVKAMIGKLTAPEGLGALLPGQGLVELPFTAAHADAIGRFPTLARHDPFDRMLLAQAYVEDLRFATADSRLLVLDLPWIVDARR